MMRTTILGLLCIAALAACGGEDPAASGSSGAEVPVKEALLCLPMPDATNTGSDPSQMNCQPVTGVQDGTIHTASCTCYVIGGKMYCYGSTCRL